MTKIFFISYFFPSIEGIPCVFVKLGQINFFFICTKISFVCCVSHLLFVKCVNVCEVTHFVCFFIRLFDYDVISTVCDREATMIRA